ncbi:MAG: cytochrome C oxidase subunit IV family protein [Planctomycetes bacterium]|nr:cytochrome C oxidase subunit IV family protein [Planctomycetota bacterium]
MSHDEKSGAHPVGPSSAAAPASATAPAGKPADEHAEEHPPVPYGVFLLVWLSLLCLTAVTVSVAGMHLGKWNVFAALGIATVKVLLVLAFFMHLKYEDRLFKAMFALAVVILAIIIGLTFVDWSLWSRP